MMTMPRLTKDSYYLNIAVAVSQRSTCLKRKYGCVLVKDDIIIATGYNGSPRNEVNCCDTGECNRIGVPHNAGDYSECCSVHAEQNAMLAASRENMIGATLYLVAIEDKCHKSTVGINCNGDCGPWCSGFYNSIVNDCKPCPICTRMIKNAGIARVVNMEGDVCL